MSKVLYEVSGGVATVTLNDPEKRNMLSGSMLSEVVAAMETARDSEEVRAVVLTGAGDKVFCAGADLGGFSAGGLGLALSCDLVIAKVGANFGTPEINVGAFPYMIMALIYRNVPRKKTNELLLLGEQISAEEAERIGIVNKVVPADEFDDAVGDWARKLASKSPVMMRLGKDAMFRQLDMPFEEALDFLRSQLTIAFSTEDIQEGVRAFFEKREPNWRGR